jgi:hypothetical protein
MHAYVPMVSDFRLTSGRSMAYHQDYVSCRAQVTGGQSGFGAILPKEGFMRRVLPPVVACLLLFSSSAFGAIVYSGSQNVTLSLSPMAPMTPMHAMIDIADTPSDDWDDFEVVLSPYLMMGTMGGGSMGTRLMIYAPGSMAMGMVMGMGGIVGLGDLASNLDLGAEIGPGSSLSVRGQALLTGSGNFGTDGGYIGLMIDNPFDGRHYGWLHMLDQSGIGTADHVATFDAWAYETEPDEPIAAGDVGVVPVPGAICLGLLGVGALGFVRSRRRSKA